MAPLPLQVSFVSGVFSCPPIQIPKLGVPTAYPYRRHRNVSSLLAVRGGSSDACPTDTTADSILHSFEEDLSNIRLQIVAEAEDEWEKWRVEMLERRRRTELARRQSRAAADISAYSRTYAGIVQSQGVKDDKDDQKAVEPETTSGDVASSALPSDGLAESEDDDNGENQYDTIASENVSDESDSSVVTDTEANGQVSANEEIEYGEEESEDFEEEDGDPSSDDVQQGDTDIDLVGDYDAPFDTDDDLIGDINDGNLQETSISVDKEERKEKNSVREHKKKKKKKKKKRRKRRRKKRRGSKSVGADESESFEDETILLSSGVAAESGTADTTSVKKKTTGSLGSGSVSFVRKVLFYTGFVLFLSLFKIVCDAMVSWALM